MNAKRFFYAAAGLFLLTAAYTLGAGRAQGQASSNRLVSITNVALYNQADSGRNDGLVAVTENGDWYYKVTYPDPTWPSAPWIRGGNIGIGSIGVGAVPWSGVKESYRK